jgi:hypothetical protein
MRGEMVKQSQVDPLYVIFEQHLYNFQDSDLDRKAFIENVLKDYLSFLRRQNIVIPKALEASILEEFSSQVHTMLMKKIYGFLTIQDYAKQSNDNKKRQARKKYTRLIKSVG